MLNVMSKLLNIFLLILTIFTGLRDHCDKKREKNNINKDGNAHRFALSAIRGTFGERKK